MNSRRMFVGAIFLMWIALVSVAKAQVGLPACDRAPLSTVITDSDAQLCALLRSWTTPEELSDAFHGGPLFAGAIEASVTVLRSGAQGDLERELPLEWRECVAAAAGSLTVVLENAAHVRARENEFGVASVARAFDVDLNPMVDVRLIDCAIQSLESISLRRREGARDLGTLALRLSERAAQLVEPSAEMKKVERLAVWDGGNLGSAVFRDRAFEILETDLLMQLESTYVSEAALENAVASARKMFQMSRQTLLEPRLGLRLGKEEFEVLTRLGKGLRGKLLPGGGSASKLSKRYFRQGLGVLRDAVVANPNHSDLPQARALLGKEFEGFVWDFLVDKSDWTGSDFEEIREVSANLAGFDGECQDDTPARSRAFTDDQQCRALVYAAQASYALNLRKDAFCFFAHAKTLCPNDPSIQLELFDFLERPQGRQN